MIENLAQIMALVVVLTDPAGSHQQDQGAACRAPRAESLATLFRPAQAGEEGSGLERDHDLDFCRRARHRRRHHLARRADGAARILRCAGVVRGRFRTLRLPARARSFFHGDGGARHRLALRRHGRSARGRFRLADGTGAVLGFPGAVATLRVAELRRDAARDRGRSLAHAHGAALSDRRRAASSCCWRSAAEFRSTTPTPISS